MTELNILGNIELAPLTTFKIGGRARYFCAVDSEEALLSALNFANERSMPVFVLGGGSNILVSDSGFNGLVVQIDLKGIVSRHDGSAEAVTAMAGEHWDSFVEYCVKRQLAGIECLSGIPGRVGGTPIQNVGAYGQDVSEVIRSVRCLDRSDHSIVEFANADCRFSYRKSRFNTTDAGRYVVLTVTYGLRRGGVPSVVYKDIREHFGSAEPTLEEVRNAVIDIRRAKSMVADDSDVNSNSAGSFFKNPVIARAKFDELADTYADVPHYPADGSDIKIPAAWLIEQAGFHKGFRKGSAGISAKHTLALVNCGGASAADIIGLKDDIQAAVLAKFDIDLIVEPIFVGFDE